MERFGFRFMPCYNYMTILEKSLKHTGPEVED